MRSSRKLEGHMKLKHSQDILQLIHLPRRRTETTVNKPICLFEGKKTSGRAFSTLENKLLKKCFWKYGKKPLRFLQENIDRKKEENNEFAQLHAQLLNKKVGLKNPRNAARNTIRKAIM